MASEATMNWRTAVEKVLKKSSEPMICSDIALEIEKKGYRKANSLGATPANTILTIINISLKNDGNTSFTRVARGLYKIKSSIGEVQPVDEADSSVSSATGIINALGMFWERSKVLWKSDPRLLGKQQLGQSLLISANRSASICSTTRRGWFMLGEL